MSDRQNSLKPIPARTPTPPFFRPLRGAGNYPWSVIQSQLVTAGFAPSPIQPALVDRIKLALFVQDVPVLLRAATAYSSPAGNTLYYGGSAWPTSTFPETGIQLVSTFGTVAGEDMLTPVAGKAGSVSQVRLTTAGITVPAYTATLRMVDRELTSDLVGNFAAYAVVGIEAGITESGVIAGVPCARLLSPEFRTPIIYPSSAYTQGIRDNQNEITGPSGTAVVVGLYEVIPYP